MKWLLGIGAAVVIVGLLVRWAIVWIAKQFS
jgi:hypothetical protein